MLEYRRFEEIADHPGLRIVLVKGMPSPWGQAAKTIFEIKGLEYIAAPWQPGEPNENIVAWGREASAPLVAWSKEKPINRWIDILYLAEKLAPKPSLIPTDATQRALMVSALFVFGHGAPRDCGHSMMRQQFKTLHQQLTDHGSVPGGPWKRGLMKFADVIGEQPGVHQHQGVHALHPLKRGAHALRTAPVLADDHEPTKSKLIDEGNQIGDMMRQRESRVDARMV
jgi:hypothetical protein